MQSILVIEDEALIRKSICEILNLKGYRTTGASNGVAGLEQARELKPDLVLCDIIMPKLTGLQMLELLRKTPGLEHVPFIFVTALSAMADVRKGMNFGADDYLTKPFDHHELLKVVTQQLKKAKIRSKNYLKEGEQKLLEILKTKPLNLKKDIHESLERAKLIQNVILPNKKQMKSLFHEHFIYYAPKDTVSGDFYWVKKLENTTLVAVADCTGHGVPGALMTMICYSNLNAAIEQHKLTNPGEILKKVNQLVVEFMRKNEAYDCSDGMDISLCAIDSSKKTIRFAGAKQSMSLITKDNYLRTETYQNLKKFSYNKYTLTKIRGSHYSIGNSDAEEFNEIEISYQNGDAIYLHSDGFSDQFGGAKNRKFKSTNLINLLLSVQNANFREQKNLIVKQLETWKADEEQTDDITVLGIGL